MTKSKQFYSIDNDIDNDIDNYNYNYNNNLNYYEKPTYDNITNTNLSIDFDDLESESSISTTLSDMSDDNSVNLKSNNILINKFTSNEIKKIAEMNPITPIDQELARTISKIPLDKKITQKINKRVTNKEPISRETTQIIQEKAIQINSNDILKKHIINAIISLDTNAFIKKNQLNIILSKIPLNDQDRENLLISFKSNNYPSVTLINNILETSYRMNDNLTDDDIHNLLKLKTSKMKISDKIMKTLNKLTLNIDDKKELQKMILTDKLIKKIQIAAINPISSNIIPDVADTISKLNLSNPINHHDANLIINNLPLKDKIAKKIIESSNKNQVISKNTFINIFKTALETANRVGKNTINTIIGAKINNNLSSSDQIEIIDKLKLGPIKENFINFDSLISYVTKKAINPNDEVSHETLEAIKNIDHKLTPKQVLLILNNTNIDDNIKAKLALNCNNNEIPSKDIIRLIIENAIQYNGQISPDVKKAVGRLVINKSKPLKQDIANKLIELPISDTTKKEIIKCTEDLQILPDETFNKIINTAIKPSIGKSATISEIISKLPITEYITDKEVDILSRKLPMSDQMKNKLIDNTNKILSSDFVNNLLQTSIKFDPELEQNYDQDSGMTIDVFIKLFDNKYKTPLNQDQLAIIEKVKKENKVLTNDDINLILQYNNLGDSNELEYNKQLINALPFDKKTQIKLIKKIKNKALTNSDLKKIKKAIKKYKSNQLVDTNLSLDTNLSDYSINSIQPISSNKISGRSLNNKEIKRLEKIINDVKHEKKGLNKILKDIHFVENFDNNSSNNSNSSYSIILIRWILFIVLTYILIRCIIIIYNNHFRLPSSANFLENIKNDMQTDLIKLDKTATCLKYVWYGNKPN